MAQDHLPLSRLGLVADHERCNKGQKFGRAILNAHDSI